MTDADDQHQELAIKYLIQDPVVPGANSETAPQAPHVFDPGRSRLHRQRIHEAREPMARCERYRGQFPPGGRHELDVISGGHPSEPEFALDLLPWDGNRILRVRQGGLHQLNGRRMPRCTKAASLSKRVTRFELATFSLGS